MGQAPGQVNDGAGAGRGDGLREAAIPCRFTDGCFRIAL